MTFKYLVVDDEPLARKLVISHASKIEGLEFAGECCDAIEASNLLRLQPVDLIFLDIQMPEIDGFQFIGTLKNPPSIILTTAFRHFAPEAFELDVVDYLLKPIAFERLLKAVNKFFDQKRNTLTTIAGSKESQNFIYLKADRKMHKISLNDILYIESLDEYIKVHLHGKVLLSRENISTLAEKLPGKSFARIHRSFIVSSRFVSSVSTEGVEINGKVLPFGRAYKLSALAMLEVRLK